MSYQKVGLELMATQKCWSELHVGCTKKNKHWTLSFVYLNPIYTRSKYRHGTPNFWHVPRLPVPRLPPGGSLSTPKILSTHWCHITFGTDTFTHHDRKLGVPCRKIVSTVPKIWRAVPIFLAGVNGVLLCDSYRSKKDNFILLALGIAVPVYVHLLSKCHNQCLLLKLMSLSHQVLRK